MTLSEKDGQLFYKLWLPLLDTLLMKVTLIPFRDVIISDGLVMPYNIVIGKNMKKQFKDIYMSAKKSGTLIKSL